MSIDKNTFDKIKAAERHTAHAVRNLKNASAALLDLEEALKTAEPVVRCKDCEQTATDPPKDVCEWLAGMFAPPCCFTRKNAEDKYDSCVDDVGMTDWCARNCDSTDYDEADCWFEFFKRMREKETQE